MRRMACNNGEKEKEAPLPESKLNVFTNTFTHTASMYVQRDIQICTQS